MNSTFGGNLDRTGTAKEIPGPRGCKYITGDPGTSDWAYCGEPVHNGAGAWCAHHDAIIHGRRVVPAPAVKPEAPAALQLTGSLEHPFLLAESAP